MTKKRQHIRAAHTRRISFGKNREYRKWVDFDEQIINPGYVPMDRVDNVLLQLRGDSIANAVKDRVENQKIGEDIVPTKIDKEKINFEFQKDNRNKFNYSFIPDTNHIKVKLQRSGVIILDYGGNVIQHEAANDQELLEVRRVVRSAMSGNLGTPPVRYRGSAINPDYTRWREWVAKRQKLDNQG